MKIRTDSIALGNFLEFNITEGKKGPVVLLNGHIYNDRNSDTYIESKVTSLTTTSEHDTLLELQNILVSTLRTLTQYCKLAPTVADQLWENKFELNNTPTNLCLYPFTLLAHMDNDCVTLKIKTKCDDTNLDNNMFEIKLATTATSYDYYFFTHIIDDLTTLVMDLMFETNRIINHQTNCVK